MECTKCGGSMSQNANKRTPNQPDWVCDQVNGQCGTPGKKPGTWYPTGAWENTYQGNVATAKQGYQTKPVMPATNGNVPAEVWEAKDRMMTMMSSIRASADIHQGSGKTEEALADALRFYDLLRQAKQGVIQRYKAPISTAGKKIASAMTEEVEVNVEDIPFN